MPRPDPAAAARGPMAPALLRSLLSDHLDPGYAAAAQHRPPRRPAAERGWQALAALLIAVVFGAAVAQARSTAPGMTAAQQVLADSVRGAQQRTDVLSGRRDGLAAQSEAIERAALANDAAGRSLLDRLDAGSLSAATTPVEGPGLQVTVTEPGVAPDLSDISTQRIPGTRQVILDRDLQLALNALWAAGAEGVAVGGVRIGPGATVRQAGGAILVDNQPIASPYIITAVGPPGQLADSFDRSSALQRLRLLETAYRVGVTVTTEDRLSLPASAGREVTFARQAPEPSGGGG